MFRTACLSALLLAAPCTALSQEVQMKSIEMIDSAVDLRRETLLDDILDADRTTRRIAVAELRGGFSDDPEVTAALLDVLEAEAGPTAPAEPMSTEARINALFLLARSDVAAWTPETVAKAQDLLATYGEAGHFVSGPQETEVLTELRNRLEPLAGAQVLFGVIQDRQEGKEQFTDLDLFVCDYAAQDTELVAAVRALGEDLIQADFGRIRLREAPPELVREVGARPGQTTIIFDKGHPEEKSAQIVLAKIEASDLPPVRLEPNRGADSYWYLSVLVCP